MYDWIDYLEISKEIMNTCLKKLHTEKRKETMLRIAISRAYYAAFHKSRDYLETYGFRSGTKDAHRSVIENIDNYVENSENQISRELDRVFTARKKADYEDSFNGLEKEAQITIKRVDSIINVISSRKIGRY